MSGPPFESPAASWNVCEFDLARSGAAVAMPAAASAATARAHTKSFILPPSSIDSSGLSHLRREASRLEPRHLGQDERRGRRADLPAHLPVRPHDDPAPLRAEEVERGDVAPPADRQLD